MKPQEYLFSVLYKSCNWTGAPSEQLLTSLQADTNTKSNKCRYCDKPVAEKDFAYTRTYFQPHQMFACHASCKAQGEKDEALACQSLDADCNDCAYFERGASIGVGMWNGICNKFNQSTKAFALTCTAHDCFEHRRMANG